MRHTFNTSIYRLTNNTQLEPTKSNFKCCKENFYIKLFDKNFLNWLISECTYYKYLKTKFSADKNKFYNIQYFLSDITISERLAYRVIILSWPDHYVWLAENAGDGIRFSTPYSHHRKCGLAVCVMGADETGWIHILTLLC